MNILYLAPEKGISYFQSGGAGTHIRGTILELRKTNNIYQYIGGDLIRKDNLKISDKNRKSILLNFLKLIVNKEIKNLRNYIMRLK